MGESFPRAASAWRKRHPAEQFRPLFGGEVKPWSILKILTLFGGFYRSYFNLITEKFVKLHNSG